MTKQFHPLEVVELPDVWRFLAEKNEHQSRSAYFCVLEDVRCGRLFGVAGCHGRISGMGAVTPIAPGLLVAWIAVLPGGLGRQLPVRAIRSLIGFVSRAGRVVAVVSETDERAQRLARAVGFRWVEAGNNGLGVWQWDQ